MKISLEALQVLEAIQRCGTFALAAKELHRVPSALTYTVNNLEEQLDIEIFDRSGHRAKFTPMGTLLVKEGHKLLIEAEQLEKRIQLKKLGFEEKLLIAYDQIIPFVSLFPLLQEFYQAYPQIELKVTGEVLGGCWDALLSNRATIAIGTTGDTPLRDDINIMPLGTTEFIFVVSKNHPLAKEQGILNNDQISDFRAIVVADSTRGFISRTTTGIHPKQLTLTVNTFEEKISALLAGLGIGYLPIQHAKKYIENGDLVIKQIPRLKSKVALSIAWRPSLIGEAGQWFIKKFSDKNDLINLF